MHSGGGGLGGLKAPTLLWESCFILQTTPDILARHVQTVCLGDRMSYFIMPVLQSLFIDCWRFQS